MAISLLPFKKSKVYRTGILMRKRLFIETDSLEFWNCWKYFNTEVKKVLDYEAAVLLGTSASASISGLEFNCI